MTNITKTNYILTNEQAEDRLLNARDASLSPISLTWIKRLVKPGKILMDVGCGQGSLTILIAQHLGPKGKVIAVDNSNACIDIAKKKARELNMTNIEFVLSDVYKLDQLAYKVDAVHCRWVLANLKRPMEAVHAMHTQLKTNGLLLLEESSGYLYDCKPYTPLSFRLSILAVKIQNLLAGTSHEVANKLIDELPKLGFIIEYSTPCVHNRTSIQKSRFRIEIESITQKLDYPLIRSLFGWWIDSLKKIEQDDSFIITERSFCQIAAKKYA